MDKRLINIADRLFEARTSVRAMPPPAQTDALADVAEAYAIQRHNNDRRERSGDQPIGRKIGLTSEAAQKQFQIDSPDIGLLWASTRHDSGASIDHSQLLYPRVEAEIAFVLGRDITTADLSDADLAACVDSAMAALEVVDSRITEWQVTLADTVADNASGWGIVCGTARRPLAEIKLDAIAMRMTRGAEPVSTGHSTAVMGNPLNALRWAAGEALELGLPLKSGEIILTGALGPAIAAQAGDHFTAEITGFPPVEVHFSS